MSLMEIIATGLLGSMFFCFFLEFRLWGDTIHDINDALGGIFLISVIFVFVLIFTLVTTLRLNPFPVFYGFLLMSCPLGVLEYVLFRRREIAAAYESGRRGELARRQKQLTEERARDFVHFYEIVRAIFVPYVGLTLPKIWLEKYGALFEQIKHAVLTFPNNATPSLFAQYKDQPPFAVFAVLTINEWTVQRFLSESGTLSPFLQLSTTKEDWKPYFEAIAQELEQALEAELNTSDSLLIGKPLRTIPHLAYSLPHTLPLALTPSHRFRHCYLIGKTGSGKSTLLKTLIAQDLSRKVGVIVISPESGLFDDLLPFIPPNRVNDLLYFDPTDTTSPVIGVNPFHFDQGDNLTQRAEETYTIFSAALGDLGVKMQPLLQNAIYGLLQHPSATLQELDRLLYPPDPSFRHELCRLPHLDERTRKFWQDYDKSTYYKGAYEPVVNRLDPFFRPPLIDILSTPSFSFQHVLNERPTIFFADLSKLRGVQSQVVGQLLLAHIQQTLLHRDTQPEEQRLPFFLFIDEFQTYAATSEGALIDLLNRARKYKMGVTLAHQVTADIPPKLLSVITGNVGTLITMQVSAEDTPFFAKELQLKTVVPDSTQEPKLRPDLLQNLAVGHAFARTPALKAGIPIAITAAHPSDPARATSAFRADLKRISKRNFGKERAKEAPFTDTTANGFTVDPPEPEPVQEEAAQSTNFINGKARRKKASPPPSPPDPTPDEADDDEIFKAR